MSDLEHTIDMIIGNIRARKFAMKWQYGKRLFYLYWRPLDGKHSIQMSFTESTK